MTYFRDEPRSQDRLCISQSKMRENDNELATIFSINHEGFNEVQAGIHKLVALEEQENEPVPTDNSIALFNMAEDLFIKRTGSTPINWTKMVQVGQWPMPMNIGYMGCKLPCGIIIKMGHNTVTAANFTDTVDMTGEYAFTQLPYIFVSEDARDGSYFLHSIVMYDIHQNDFSVKTTARAVRFTWIAIGI